MTDYKLCMSCIASGNEEQWYFQRKLVLQEWRQQESEDPSEAGVIRESEDHQKLKFNRVWKLEVGVS